MTLPTLIQKHQEKAKVTALKKFYSTISQAFQFAVMEHGTPDQWGMTLDSSEILLKYIQPQMKFLKICTVGEKCHPAEKLFLRKGTVFNNLFNPKNKQRFSAVLPDGMIMNTYIQNPDCNAVYASGKYLENVCGEYIVDVNGGKGPNKYGDDLFIFTVTKYGIIPNGAQIFENNTSDGSNPRYNPKYYRFDSGCLSSEAEGWGCSAWVIYNENMDYWHCDDLSWDGKKKCK